MQWEFHKWGVHLVLSGHDHIYSRLEHEGETGLNYIVNGLGGKSLYTCNEAALDPSVSTLVCFDENYGAMRCLVTQDQLEIAFYSIDNPDVPVDQFHITK